MEVAELTVTTDAKVISLVVPLNVNPVRRRPGNRGGLSILYAEDSYDNRFLLEVYLIHSGHRLTCVENGLEALELFQQRQFDLILMDLQMPVMDGVTATRLIRHWELLEGRPPTPILACTAHAMTRERIASFEVGCNKHLSKPFSKAGLLSAIAEFDTAASCDEKTVGAVFIDIPEGLEELNPIYLAGLRREVQTLLVLFGNAEFAAMEGICHNFKGTGTSYGFPQVTYLGEIMELAVQNAEIARLGAGLQELSIYLDSVQLRKRADVRPEQTPIYSIY
jgi:CheY-like chemotaxis protein